MIYIVTGFMRSGTSMLMQACEAGGLPVARDLIRDEKNRLASDAHYQPNPHGLYEVLPTRFREPGFSRQYDAHALKLLAPDLGYLVEHQYRVAWMHRNAEEIRQSYEAAFGYTYLTCAIIDHVTATGLDLLRNRPDVHDICELSYSDVVANPLSAIKQLAWPLHLKAAPSVVDPTWYRFRQAALTAGL